MLNQTVDTMADHSWVPSSACHRASLFEARTAHRKPGDLLEELPVMSSTVLGLEILLNEPCIDLGAVSELILSDVGATLHILRLVGHEYETATEHPSRMADCLASLDAGAWFETIAARAFPCDADHRALTALWSHCRLVAQYAQLVAESIQGVSPEEAYLVGLLHEIADISSFLDRPVDLCVGSEAALGEIEASLPLFVLSAIRSIEEPSYASPWRFILSEAHKLAGSRTH
jgi:hypothetical protein